MSSRRDEKEVLSQDYSKIKLMYLPKALSSGKLFTDLSFPPDLSSLTYVYSGDDRYEKMVFKRPRDICNNAAFVGTGGAYNAPFPWQRWKKSGWFEAAVCIVSLSSRHMEKLVNGYRNMDQSMQRDYIGAFNFSLWRFGQWLDVVVDDFLPTLNNGLLYCPAHGHPPEYWGPLVEKAYAKCKKTYEAIECGSTLDALTDLTGAICEFFTPDINPPENLFHILYKSSVNRSMIVCWRNEKRLTPNGYEYINNVYSEKNHNNEDDKNVDRYLHIITATSKFPITDGRLIEVVRLKCPFQAEPTWNGKFAKDDEMSWCSVNAEFLSKYNPLSSRDEDEYWMTLEDFRCNFGGLVICSGTMPFKPEGLNLERCFVRRSDDDARSCHKLSLISNGEEKTMNVGNSRSFRMYSVPDSVRNPAQGQRLVGKRKKLQAGGSVFKSKLPENEEQTPNHEITVRENTKTVIVDNRERVSHRKSSRKHTSGQGGSPGPNSEGGSHVLSDSCLTDSVGGARNTIRSRYHVRQTEKQVNKQQPGTCTSWRSKYPDKDNAHGKSKVTGDVYGRFKRHSDLDDNKPRSASIISEMSTFSTSDITVDLPCSSHSRDGSLKRPTSAPGTVTSSARASSSSLPNITVHNFLAIRSDHFRSHGSWCTFLEYQGHWEKSQFEVSRVDMRTHARNQRILLTVLHADAVNEVITPGFQGKAHVLISLLQDYRHGASTANSLLVSIGLCVYRSKTPAKDEKRSLSKLQLVGEIGPAEDLREVSGRFDLDPGNYFIVPYCLSETHEGRYLVRVLAEKDPVAGKTGCSIS